MNRTSKQAADTIAHLAAGSFKEHVLTKQPDGTWRCRKPGDSHYWFGVFTAPGCIFVWGDIGPWVFRVSDKDSLGWYLTATARDYFIGKIEAQKNDSTKREFMYTEAMAYLDEAERERRAEIVEDLSEDCVGDQTPTSAIYVKDERIISIIKVREAMSYVSDAHHTEQRRAWWDAMTDNGFDDPPDCDFWSADSLWAWEACQVFRRLHAALPAEVETAS